MHIKGKAWTFGRNVNTDLIFPKMWFRPTYEPGEMASHLMVGIDEKFPAQGASWRHHRRRPEFRLRFEPRGSCRRHEGNRHRRRGRAEFRPSLHAQCINVGLPIVTSRANRRASCARAMRLKSTWPAGRFAILRSGYEARLPPMAPESLKLIEDGGIANYTRRVLSSGGRAARAGR